MPRSNTGAVLSRLERWARTFGDGAGAEKLRALASLTAHRLPNARQVRRLHEVLCFLRAYPDDRALLDEVERALLGFSARADVRAFREELADSGIAGTPLHYRFHFETARWLAERFPGRLTVDWAWWAENPGAERLLELVVDEQEAAGLDAVADAPRWIAALCPPGLTDAELVLRRLSAVPMDERARVLLFDALALPMRLAPGVSPSRTIAKLGSSRVVLQGGPLSQARPKLGERIHDAPRRVRVATGREAASILTLAREAMVTRARDLDGIIYADVRDVRVVETGDGLDLACFGLRPDARALVETLYVFLLLKNGVPIGYFQAALLFGSAELNYNVFEPFRGVEAAEVYARSLAAVRHLFGVDTFAVDPYQLGKDNPEALASGAFWFYAKLGFVPASASVRRVLASETRAMSAEPSHRSSAETLRTLADGYLHFCLGAPRGDVAGKVSPAHLALAVSRWVSARHGADREAGQRVCQTEVRRLLGLRSLRGWTRDERQALERWSPLVMALEEVARWAPSDRDALVGVIRAKGAIREQLFAERLDAHGPLRRALARLARPGNPRADL